MKVLVTGAAGFIGYFTAKRLLERGDEVVGVDNMNAYYDVRLKEARIARLMASAGFRFERLDLADSSAMLALFARERFDQVVHLGAQAGVRHSLKDPLAYASSNLTGTLNVLEGCRHNPVRHLVYASSSSVYGASARLPYDVHEPASHPLSFYAATKRANELMAYSYASLYGIASTGLRFFTVYGPWGRPDMALFTFTRAILAGQPIEVFNNGQHKRDFTYVEDIVEGVLRVLDRPARADGAWDARAADPATGQVPHRLYNIGSHRPILLLRFIEVLEGCLGMQAEKIFRPIQPGDVPDTLADVTELVNGFGYRPDTPIEVGVARFVEWYREFYAVQEVQHG